MLQPFQKYFVSLQNNCELGLEAVCTDLAVVMTKIRIV